ncbi:MAG: hypothetical protein ABUL66_00495 [Verrucomicrobiota bacterium]
MSYQDSLKKDYAARNRLSSRFSTGKWLLISFPQTRRRKIIFPVSTSGIWKHGDGARASARFNGQ